MPLNAAQKNRYQLLIQLGAVLRLHPGLPLWEALSAGQVASKKWLIEELEKLGLELGNIFVLGGWWGLLPAMMFESELRFQKIRSFDIDPSCAAIAETMNRAYLKEDWAFKASTADMCSLDYHEAVFTTLRSDGSVVELRERPDTLINTSCEHLADFAAWWARVPRGKLLALQSNDFTAHPEHVNCVKSLEEFEQQAPLSRVLYRGELALQDYRRFLLIGMK